MAGSRIGAVAGALTLAAALTLTLAAPMAPDGAAPDGASVTLGAGSAPGEARYAMPLEGEVVAPFDDPDAPWAAGHRGVDIAGGLGMQVHAAADGVVAFVGVVVDRPVISIDHPDGIRTTYEPVAALVEAGDAVVQGQPIGTLVDEGSHCAPAACLHWGARVGEDYVDPLSLLSDAVIRLYPLTRAGAPA
ncbi:M23 family metallopeptidase [Pseudactinotalea suaedae]|uniref:M23 family metallopeptidase n=1 Tax=Pseudactinotalea suaedae TaxID=1524924 RepID=UPI0012E25FB8|nr:M23 family metallopeptidase [Pseudactinotalea suaedae]